MLDWSQAITILETHKAELQLKDDDARDAYLTEVRSFTSREKEDHQKATEIAVDAAKTFVQIAIAFIVASVGFAQFSLQSGSSIVRVLLFASGSFAFISMCFGFAVISRAYKRGDGRISKDQPPWSTEGVKNPINWQARTGLVCLLSFVVALSLFNWGTRPRQMTIILPNKTTKTIVNLESFTISGEWSNLGITQPGFTLALDGVPPSQKHEVRFDLK